MAGKPPAVQVHRSPRRRSHRRRPGTRARCSASRRPRRSAPTPAAGVPPATCFPGRFDDHGEHAIIADAGLGDPQASLLRRQEMRHKMDLRLLGHPAAPPSQHREVISTGREAAASPTPTSLSLGIPAVCPSAATVTPRSLPPSFDRDAARGIGHGKHMRGRRAADRHPDRRGAERGGRIDPVGGVAGRQHDFITILKPATRYTTTGRRIEYRASPCSLTRRLALVTGERDFSLIVGDFSSVRPNISPICGIYDPGNHREASQPVRRRVQPMRSGLAGPPQTRRNAHRSARHHVRSAWSPYRQAHLAVPHLRRRVLRHIAQTEQLAGRLQERREPAR